MDNIKRDNIIKFRRDLHKIPELDFDLPKTTGYILDYLEKLPCEITRIGKASFVAFFNAGKTSSVAFRTDMDALPIEEKTGLDFCSVHGGNMHACGHDGHMSIVLGLASELPDILEKINKNVLLVFQAAEETTGGAKEICDSGVFTKYNVEKIYGLHIWPGFPSGTVICRKGDFMAGTKVIWGTVKGKSSHIAKPEEGIDALEIGTKLVQRIYQMEREEIPLEISRIFKFGEFNSGTGVNILSGETNLGGTIRYYDPDILDKMLNRTEEISNELMEEFKCNISFKTPEGYPPVKNPPELYDELEKTVSQLHEIDNLNFFNLDKPLMTAEDFSYYQRKLPGLFFFLGTGRDLTLHNENYDINEDILPIGVEIFTTLLLNN